MKGWMDGCRGGQRDGRMEERTNEQKRLNE